MSILQIPTARVFAPLFKPSRYKAAHGGRGSGKTHFFGEHLIRRCLAEPGLRSVCIREVQKSIKESSKRLIEDKIRKFNLGTYFDVQENQIKTPGDGLIIFTGMQNHTAESIKSLEGYKIAWPDEAQALSQRSLDILRPTMRGDAEIWFSWNPRSAKDPVDSLMRSGEPPPRSIVVEANWHDNPWFPDDLREEMEYLGPVRLSNVDTEKEETYQIVGPEEADIKIGRISVASPLARGLLGREVGDEVKLQMPAGPRSYEILEISFA